MIQKLLPLIFISIFLLFACDSGISSNKKNGLVKKKSKDGTVTEIYYKDGIKHGLATTYYKNGNVSVEMDYVDGEKQGEAKWYYQDKDRLLYQVTNFETGKKEGLRTRYHRDGKVMAEMPYHNDFLGLGTKEYGKSGNEIKDHENVKIDIKAQNTIKKNAEYTLELRLPKGYTKVKYYHGELTENRYLNDTMIAIKKEKGVGMFRMKVPPNTGLTRDFTIVAHAKTALGNDILFSQKKTVNINNY